MKTTALTILVTTLMLTSLLACRNNEESGLSGSAVAEVPSATIRTIPTLYPTTTALPTPSPSSTRPPEPTEVPSTPIDFEQVAVEVRYQIPSISLDRKIVGNVANRIFLDDLTTGKSVELPDQPGILLELQQVFGRLALEELPASCVGCVVIDFTLPIAGIGGSGWLTDTQLLASLENFTTVHLSPHFPPGTVLGLRKSATAYQVAQSIALTSDNRMWQWTATDSQVGESTVTDILPFLVGDVPDRETLEELQTPVAVDCPSGPGIETLMISTLEQPFSYRFSCPELSLPTSLVSLYSLLDDHFNRVGDDTEITEPTPYLELDTVLKYVQTDGLDLTIFTGGRTVLTTTENISLTTILTESLVISKTTELIDSSGIELGATAFLADDTDVLFIRGPSSVFSFAWVDEEDPAAERIRRTIRDLIEVVESTTEEAAGNQPGTGPPATATDES